MVKCFFKIEVELIYSVVSVQVYSNVQQSECYAKMYAVQHREPGLALCDYLGRRQGVVEGG